MPDVLAVERVLYGRCSPAIPNRLPGNGLAILPSVARGCSVKSAERANEFFGNPEHQVSGTLRVLRKVVASAQTCATLRVRELQNADRYFESIGNSVPLSNQLQPSVNPCRYQARSG
jgi:hypothetical protein